MSTTTPGSPPGTGSGAPGVAVSADEAAGILQLADADPAAARALAIAFAERVAERADGGARPSGSARTGGAARPGDSGEYGVGDALWWRAHPLTRAPSGLDDPAAERAVLQAQAFSRQAARARQVEVLDPATGERVTVPAHTAALLDLEARLAADASALDAAIEDARPALDAARAREAARGREAEHALGSRSAPGSRVPSAAAGGDDLSGLPATHGADELSAPAATHAADRSTAPRDDVSWRRRSQVWMWTAIVCALVLLGGVGLVVLQHVAPGAAGTFALLPAAASTGIQTPQPAQTLSSSRGLTIFEDPTLAPSIPPANIDPYYKPDSLRLLGVADATLTVYAVENRLDQPCLLAVYTDGTQSATCVTKAEFASMGIELRLTSLQVTENADGISSAPSQDIVFWNPDGSYGVSSSPGSTASPAPAG